MGDNWFEVDTKTSFVVPEPFSGHRGPTSCIVHVSDRSASATTKLLDREELTIGRGDDCSLSIACSHISRLHAIIRRDDEDIWTIYDNNSVNGILVNGAKVASASLCFGDRIDLGRGEILLYRPYDEDYQRAVEAQKLEALGRLASGIAHDFNNVLMAIVGAATCLREDLGAIALESGNGLIGDTIDDIMTASNRGADLARQLLGFAKQGGVNNEIVMLTDLVDEVTRLIERTFQQGIRISRVNDSDASVVADRIQLTQVLMNICINARDSMPNGGELKISIRDAAPLEKANADRFVCVELSDTGVGMSPEVRERVFEPFFSTKGEGRGTGLGMSTTYGIVKNCGGVIEIDSQVNVGTTVRVYLPAQKSEAREALSAMPDSRTRQIAPSGNGRRILLAEDQVLIRRHTSRILKRLGFIVIEAGDGEEAIQAVKSAGDEICLAMLDLQMPKRNGDEVFRLIRALDPGLPVVMCSGNIEDARISALVDAGEVDVLGKPYDLEELSRVLGGARDD